jgi:tetratricopeptide (TPR) repeat protein
MYCENCGNEVFVVPDYNSIDELLEAEVRDGIEDSQKMQINRIKSGNISVRDRNREAELKRRRMQKAKKERMRKIRIRNRIILAVVVVLIVIVSFLMYHSSYTGIMKKADKAYNSKDYDNAVSFYKKAISKNEKKAAAYVGLSKVYLSEQDEDLAETVFLDALKSQEDNAEIYNACFEFYLNTNQNMKIPEMYSEASDMVQEKLAKYHVAKPTFSLDATIAYDDVQQVTLETKKGYTIYFTTNDTPPTLDSQVYTAPIQLEEGETTIQMIAVNKENIPSETVMATYVVEFPEIDAPAVSPSTGQYSVATNVTIQIPSGYKAYYTTDGSVPTVGSIEYTEPVPMPNGETIFKAILVSKDGRVSDVTTRNYMFESLDSGTSPE